MSLWTRIYPARASSTTQQILKLVGILAALFVFSSLVRCGGANGTGDAGGTTIVGTWNRPGTSTSAGITMVLSGTTTSGTAAIDGTSTGINNDPPCTQNTQFVATYNATATTITFSGTSGTFNQMGCTNSSDNKPTMPLPMPSITNTLASFDGTYIVSATTLTIVSGSTTTTLNRK